jgi:hypothetical protein
VTYQQVTGNANVVGSGGNTAASGAAITEGTGDATGQAVATAGHSTTKTSSTATKPKDGKPNHWWNNLWLITIVGGAIAAIGAALVLTLLH